MQDHEYIIDLAVDLANEALEVFEAEGKIPLLLTGIRNTFYRLVEAVRGVAPSGTELDALCAELQVNRAEDQHKCELCYVDTRLRLDNTPTVWFYECDMDSANEALEENGLVWLTRETIEQEARERYAAKQEANRNHLNAEEREALLAYAAANGRTWKARLRAAWEKGQVDGVLQQLHTARYFGPMGLLRFKLPAKAKI